MMKKVVVITGAATGLGRATALKLATQGFNLVLVDFNEQQGLQTMKDAQALGAEALFVKADVSNEEEVKHYVAQAVETFGTIDFFFNNAGIMVPFRLLHDYTTEEYNRIMDINLKGPFLGIKHVIPVMLANGGGTIINTVSSNSFKPTAYNGIYSATKHALAAFTKSIGQDYQEQQIYAVGVAPNTMQTTIAQSATVTLDATVGAAIHASTGKNIAATADEVAESMIFAMENGKLLTGSIINCAGGEIYN
ncbi:NAD(P)-dependent dehydrogenase (short-subunit alcohol dehydrogenase family) [Kurthia huakuii]|uniref:SDR family NAD(P)-dependent oxidoreductase n=2 Tax=Kurthia huakuii TaxID=1421019 RepID=UPI000494F6BB|nr:SDR family oxidoreductase [Kurthia huakuii]MBM7698618.1 NAD(P)-dependent dehydrogenase (short-subunit alcohol dehydrogenase family) [Kurthia huakuii]